MLPTHDDCSLVAGMIYIFCFHSGFKVHEVLQLLQRHPINFMHLLTVCTEAQLTADFVETLFSPQFSPEGCNKRQAEMVIFLNWHEFLEETESENSFFDIQTFVYNEQYSFISKRCLMFFININV